MTVVTYHCPCCGNVCNCRACVGGLSPYEWTFTATGFTNPLIGCTNCTSFNGTFTLRWLQIGTINYCYWETSGSGMTLNYDPPTDTWTLTLNGSCTVTYTLANSSWDCCGTNVMNLASNGGCLLTPATITLTPVQSCPSDSLICTFCCNSRIPNTLYATLTNIRDCACIPEDTVITLTYQTSGGNKGQWTGSLAIDCSLTMTIVLDCLGCPTSACHWRLFYVGCHAGVPFSNDAGGAVDDFGYSCNPLELHYGDVEINPNGSGLVSCCNDAANALIDIDITE